MNTDHTHKYKRVLLGGKRIVIRDGKKYLENTDSAFVVFKCMIPGCTHYIARELAVGRKSICWRCGGELILSANNLRQAKPVHRECTRARVA